MSECSNCEGSGDCPECHGIGEICMGCPVHMPLIEAVGASLAGDTTCEECGGSGKCTHCHGSGDG